MEAYESPANKINLSPDLYYRRPSYLVNATIQYRQKLLDEDAIVSRDMVRAYGRIYEDLQIELDGLYRDIEAGRPVDYLYTRIHQIQQSVETRIKEYAAFADEQVMKSINTGTLLGSQHAVELVKSSYPIMGDEIVRELWNQVPTGAVESMLGMLSPGSPLRHRMQDRLGEAVAESGGEHLVKGVAMGLGPAEMHRLMRASLGQGLDWSLTQTRTAALWAYREAERAEYIANPELVKGWTWNATRDLRTCMSCIALDGSFHQVTEPLCDHYAGRCVPLPALKTYEELGIPIGQPTVPLRDTGMEWFSKLSPEDQRKMMGAQAWEEWQSKKFSLKDYATMTHDGVYGDMFVQRSLKHLLNPIPDNFEDMYYAGVGPKLANAMLHNPNKPFYTDIRDLAEDTLFGVLREEAFSNWDLEIMHIGEEYLPHDFYRILEKQASYGRGLQIKIEYLNNNVDRNLERMFRRISELEPHVRKQVRPHSSLGHLQSSQSREAQKLWNAGANHKKSWWDAVKVRPSSSPEEREEIEYLFREGIIDEQEYAEYIQEFETDEKERRAIYMRVRRVWNQVLKSSPAGWAKEYRTVVKREDWGDD
jgi:hypothetical protein